tara:strand:+ start:217073 stop:218332 length:1260 start_codon:yes stop_codon:yes gene_type:complete
MERRQNNFARMLMRRRNDLVPESSHWLEANVKTPNHPFAGQGMPPRHDRLILWLMLFAIPLGIANGQGGAPTDLPKLPDDPASVIARVGESPILLGELQPKADARIKQVMEKTGQKIPPEQLQMARTNLIRGLLAQAIQSKMMREAFLLDQVGTEAAEKHAEAREMMSARARQMFIETEADQLIEKYEVNDLTELDERLRAEGSSLAARRRDFVDAMLGHMYIRSNVEREPHVSVAEIVAYYTNHQDEFQHSAQARWEQLTVLFSRFESKQAAKAAISAMGREAYFGGNVQAVARDKSQGPFADKGGLHDWTTKGALASTILDEQIFSLPLNAMSQIIEDEQGYHIVRILDRKEAGITPLKDVQEAIREKLQKEKIMDSERKAMASMRERVPVWSIFPDDVPGAKPLPQIATRPRANNY